jgi:hypothetical protein
VRFREEKSYIANVRGQQSQVRVSYVRHIELNNITAEDKPYMQNVCEVFNNIMKEALDQLDYKQIGKFPKFFNAKDKRDVDPADLNLVAWPGYQVEVKLTTQGIFLNVESCTKFVNKISVLHNFIDSMRNGYSERDFFEQYNSSNIEIPRKTVITEHNSRSYQVDGMTKQSPYEIMMTKRDGTSISIAQYF